MRDAHTAIRRGNNSRSTCGLGGSALRYQGRKRVHHADDAMAQILTDMPNAVEMAWSESVNQVPRRSRFAFASVVSVAVGCASNRRRSIGSPVSSQ
jgi:hypothetical protein